MKALVLLLACLLSCTAALMSRSEAIKELRLPKKFDEKTLKAAYRQRSMETHPDKGGTKEAFLRVSDAYQMLSASSGGARSSAARGAGARGSGAPARHTGSDHSMSEEERMRHAEEMLDSVLEELEELLVWLQGRLTVCIALQMEFRMYKCVIVHHFLVFCDLIQSQEATTAWKNLLSWDKSPMSGLNHFNCCIWEMPFTQCTHKAKFLC